MKKFRSTKPWQSEVSNLRMRSAHHNAVVLSIKDDVLTITQLFWEVEVTQGNENEC